MMAVHRLTVLYDPSSDFCVRCRRWLEREPKTIALRFAPRGSSRQARLYPDLELQPDDRGPLEELVVIDDRNRVYRGDKAWVVCLYALRRTRALAVRLSRPGMTGLARRAYALVSRDGLALWALMVDEDDASVRRAIEAEPEPPRCSNVLSAMREARRNQPEEAKGVLR
ncbi:MAG: DCC1-like thiol-disulfide oxidoreductase family protein [Phycisphaeraceae bacterium]